MLCCLLPVSGCTAKADSNDVKLYCLNIGKADCLILCCAGKNYLIDTGYEHNFPALEAAFSALNIHHLDGVFLTHCHEDHQGGLMRLSRSNITIDHFYAASIYYNVKESKHPMVLAAKERSMDVKWLSSGDIIQIADGYSFRVLGPLQVNEENENNNSLVMYFSSPHGSILFTGDMKDIEENELMYDDLLQPCDILKVGHHGDNGATSKSFLTTVRPKCAIITTHSQQEPDTPAPQVLFRLSNFGCNTYITQDSQDAYFFTLQKNTVSVQDVAWPNVPKRIENIVIKADLDRNVLILTNQNSEPIHLKDCTLYLSKKDKVFFLNAISLKPNESYIIGDKKSGKDADMKLDVKKLMDDNKLDSAILYDAYGRIIAICNNGQDE